MVNSINYECIFYRINVIGCNQNIVFTTMSINIRIKCVLLLATVFTIILHIYIKQRA